MSELRRLSRLVKTGASFMRGATEMSQLPLYYWIEPTSACNLRCIMCPTGLGLKRKPGMMDLGMFTRLLDEIGPLRPVINLHHSGEPLLHPQIHEMTRRARERGAFVGYFTNATKLDAPMRAKILDGPPNWIGFSFDGYDRETYESVRVKATWDEALGNIERFLAERRARGQKEPYTYLSTIEVPGQNVDWAAKRATFRAHLRSMGLDQMSVANTHTWAGSMSWLANGEVRQNSTCPFPWTGLGILWDGAVVPCCMDLEGSHPVGHLGQQSLWEVWNGEPMRDLRTKLSTKRAHEIPLCKDCTVLQDRAYFGVPARAWQDLFDVARTELHRALP